MLGQFWSQKHYEVVIKFNSDFSIDFSSILEQFGKPLGRLWDNSRATLEALGVPLGTLLGDFGGPGVALVRSSEILSHKMGFRRGTETDLN